MVDVPELKLKAEFQEVEHTSTTPHRKYHKSMSNHVPRFSLAFCIGPRTDSSTEQTPKANLYKVPRNGNFTHLYSTLLTRQRWTLSRFLHRTGSCARRTGSVQSMLCPSRAGASRLLRRIGAQGPALLGRAAREAAYRPIRGPHPSRFITPQYPKPVSFFRRLLHGLPVLLLQRVEEEQPQVTGNSRRQPRPTPSPIRPTSINTRSRT